MDWDVYYSRIVSAVAEKSKDSTKVGAILVGPNKEIRLTAFNGPPAGVEDTLARRTKPEKYLFASHAEANLIAFAARCGIRTEGCTVVVTHYPCSGCAKALIQAGIIIVLHGPGTTSSMPAAEFEAAGEMFWESGVTVSPLNRHPNERH